MILSIFACNAYPAAQRYCRQLIAAARIALPPIQYDAGWGQNRVKVVEGGETGPEREGARGERVGVYTMLLLERP